LKTLFLQTNVCTVEFYSFTFPFFYLFVKNGPSRINSLLKIINFEKGCVLGIVETKFKFNWCLLNRLLYIYRIYRPPLWSLRWDNSPRIIIHFKGPSPIDNRTILSLIQKNYGENRHFYSWKILIVTKIHK